MVKLANGKNFQLYDISFLQSHKRDGYVCIDSCHVFIFSSLDLYKEFQEEAYSVAIHPSGLFILVGFSEKLRLMNLLIDDIRPFKEFVIRGCKEVTSLSLSLLPSSSSLILTLLFSSVRSAMVVTSLLLLTPLSFNSFLLTLLRTLATSKATTERY